MNSKFKIAAAIVGCVFCLLPAVPCHAFGPPDHECGVCGNGTAHCVTVTRDKKGNWSYYESYIDARTGRRWSVSKHSWEIELERKQRAEPGPVVVNPYCENAKANLLQAQLTSRIAQLASKDNVIINPYCADDPPRRK